MSHPDPDYTFPPNWKPKKKFNCKKWILPSTLLINGRINQVNDKEGTSVKGINQPGFTCAICGSYYTVNRERANFHMFQNHYEELCKLAGDAIPPELRPDFSQPTWGLKYIKGKMQVSNDAVERPVNMRKDGSSNEKIHRDEQSDENPKEMLNRKASKWRCNKCQNCLKLNCKVCKACRDMTKYGGPGTFKQSCLKRQKCLKFFPTLENVGRPKKLIKLVDENENTGEREPQASGQKIIKKVGRPKKLTKLRNENMEVQGKVQTNVETIEDIPPFRPRVFPLSDKDYDQMMGKDTSAGICDTDENANQKKMKKRCKDILIPKWKFSEKELTESIKGSRDDDDNFTEEMNRSRKDTLEEQADDNDHATDGMNGPGENTFEDYDDFYDIEDTSDEAYELRHAKAKISIIESC